MKIYFKLFRAAAWLLVVAGALGAVGRQAHADRIYGISNLGSIYRAPLGVNLDGSEVEIVLPSAFALVPAHIAVDPIGGKLYWAENIGEDLSTTKLRRADLDGTNIEDLVIANDDFFGLALDLENGKIYYSSEDISRSNLDGSDKESLFDADWPSSLALHLDEEEIYWVEPLERTISKANLDGSDKEVLLRLDNAPRSLVLDTANGKMYWTLLTAGSIYRANLDGSDPEVFLTTCDAVNCISEEFNYLAMDVDAGKIYWSDFDDSAIRRVNVDRSDIEFVISASATYIALEITPIPEPGGSVLAALALVLLGAGWRRADRSTT